MIHYTNLLLHNGMASVKKKIILRNDTFPKVSEIQDLCGSYSGTQFRLTTRGKKNNSLRKRPFGRKKGRRRKEEGKKKKKIWENNPLYTTGLVWMSESARLATVSSVRYGEQWASDANKDSHDLWFCHRRAFMVKTEARLCVTSHTRLPGLRQTLVCEWCHSPVYHRVCVCVCGGGLRVCILCHSGCCRVQPEAVSTTNSEVNSVTKHSYNCMLDDGIY